MFRTFSLSNSYSYIIRQRIGMRAKEFKMLMEFCSTHVRDENEILDAHIDEIYFLQSIWKKYFGEVDYLKIYPNFKIDSSKIFSLSQKMDHFLTEHKEKFKAEKSNLVFHGHIIENYKFFFIGNGYNIDISNLIKFDQI